MPGNIKIPQWVDSFLDKSPAAKRRKLSPANAMKPRPACSNHRKYSENIPESQLKWDYDAIVSFFKSHCITTRRGLESYRRRHGDGLTVRTILNFFESFDACVLKCFELKKMPKKECDRHELILNGIRFDITTMQSYIDARKSFPDVFPSMRYVIKCFGRFSNYRKILNSCKSEAMLEKFLLLYNSTEKMPMRAMCLKYGIDYDSVVSGFRTRNAFQRFIDELRFKIGD